MAYTERVFISEFSVQPSKHIAVRKTTEVLKDGKVISQSFWRTVLSPNDPEAASVLNDETYYLKLAELAWADLAATDKTAAPTDAEGAE